MEMRLILRRFFVLLHSSTLLFLFVMAASRFSSLSSRSTTLKQVKNTRIVQSEGNAGEGIPNRLQCSGNRSIWAPPRCPNSQQDRITLVSLFIPPTDNKNPNRILRAFLQSAQFSMPASRRLLLTDQAGAAAISRTNLPAQALPMSGNFSRGNLMLQRLESYVAFLESWPDHGHVVFTDSDMLLVGDLGCVFSDHPDFDVGLTFRSNKEQPINSGVIFVRSASKGKRLLEKVVEVYKREFTWASRMMGDQMAFAKVVDQPGEVFKGKREFEAEVDGVKVLFLPCSVYNWTPAEGAGQFHGMPVETRVMHFKGSRKRLMVEAWEGYGRGIAVTGNVFPLACFVLRSGRSKYDF